MKNKRDINVDITRIFAYFSVISVHFFLNSGFYNTPVIGERMTLMVYFRTLFMICVPLFLLLTGYLYSERNIVINKTTIKKHITKLLKIVYTYLTSVFFICIFKKYYLGNSISIIKSTILNALNFTEYSWYVNMYFGLFLMIPFLNMVWINIEDHEGHLILIGILMFLTMSPSVFNIYDLQTPMALLKPWISTTYTQIVPDWWTNLYPITYYYIGAYFRKYVNHKKYNTKKLFALLIITVLVFGSYNVWRCYSIKFIKGLWCHPWGSFQNTTMSVLCFLIINSIECNLEKYNRVLVKISELSFGAYLLSWIPDKMLYPLLSAHEPNMVLRFNYFPIIVPLVIMLSLGLSLLADTVINCMLGFINRFKTKVKL